MLVVETSGIEAAEGSRSAAVGGKSARAAIGAVVGVTEARSGVTIVGLSPPVKAESGGEGPITLKVVGKIVLRLSEVVAKGAAGVSMKVTCRVSNTLFISGL